MMTGPLRMSRHLVRESSRLAGHQLVRSEASRSSVNLGTNDDQKKRSCTAIPHPSPDSSSYLRAIPGPGPSLPFIGTGWQYLPGGRYNLFKLHEASLDKYLRYGPVVREEYQWRHPVVHSFSPDDFETVFRHQGKHPLRPVNEFLRHYRLNRPHKYDSAGLANSVGQEWYRLRVALTPVLLRMKSLEMMLRNQNDICNDLVSLLRCVRDPQTNMVTNLQETLYKLALESIYMMSLDTRLGCLHPNLRHDSDASVMITASKKMFEAYQELYFGMPLWKVVETPSYRKLDEAESAIYESASHHIERAIRRLREQGGSGEPGVLETLLKVQGLTDKEVRVTVIDFIAGGIFTVTNSLCFLLFHLANNPDVQDKLYRELQSVSPDGEISAENLANLPYLKACVKETFRLTPTVPCLARLLPDDVALSGYNVPAGTPIFCHFKVTCQQAQYFPNADSFQPERWLHGSRSYIHPFSMLPFGFGYRMCVGRRFSETQLYLTAAKVVHNFRLESTSKDLDVIQAFIIVPVGPVSIVMHDR